MENIIAIFFGCLTYFGVVDGNSVLWTKHEKYATKLSNTEAYRLVNRFTCGHVFRLYA